MSDAIDRYQSHDEHPSVLWLLAGGSVAAIACASLASFVARDASTPGQATPNPSRPSAADVRAFPEPRLEADEIDARERARAEESRLLEGWAWADRERGFARIPVER